MPHDPSKEHPPAVETFDASCYAIGELELFHGVPEQAVCRILADCPVLRLAPGEAVPNSSSNGGAKLYIVLRGALAVTPAQPGGLGDGGTTKVLRGESVGELSVLDDEAAASPMSALQQTELLAIDAARLWQMIDESNGVARNLLRLLAFRVRAANAQIRKRQKVGEFYRQLSLVDGLTELHNRTWLNEHLPALIASAHALGNPLSVIMIDIDHFKQFNDVYGHLAGDDALKATAKVVAETLRPRDFAARFGGEELIVILPGASLKAGAIVANRICEQMRRSVVFADMHKPLPHMTASFGVAALAPGQDADALIKSADAALYRAKAAGRNQVAVQT